MSTQRCRECQSSFEPQRSTQLYCSAKCSHASRDRNQPGGRRVSARQTKRRLIAGREKGAGVLRTVASDNQRQLRKIETPASQTLNGEVFEREQTIDELHCQLRKLATVNVDLCGELAETKALNTELRQEVARILRTHCTDAKDLMHLGARLLQLTDRLGIRLDEQTAQIYSRRGWPTRIPATIR